MQDQISTREAASGRLIPTMALTAAALIANLYYAQPLIALIAPQLAIAPNVAGAVVSVTQVGYGVGLFLVVPLADLVENRSLVLLALGVTAASLLVLGLSQSAAPFFVASFVVGVSSTCAQVLLPFVAHLAAPERRGRVVGNVMACVLAGIMLARPLALILAGSFGWRSVFLLSALVVLGMAVALSRLMPRYMPSGGDRYGVVLRSMLRLLVRSPVLLRRSLYQFLLFGAFNLFWTAAPIVLATRFGLDEHGIALFALAGAGGALAAPVAGRLADRGWVRAATVGASLALALAFGLTGWAVAVASGEGLIALVLLAVLIDAAAQMNQVVTQRIIFAVPASVRGRVNGVYMSFLFAGGAAGSLAATVSLHLGGWAATAGLGAAMGLAVLLLIAADGRGEEWIDTESVLGTARR